MKAHEQTSVIKTLYMATLKTNRTMLFLSFPLALIFIWLSYHVFVESCETNLHITFPVYVSNSTNARDLLLFSYMRSGSTLTAELLRDSPGTFFVFEPLIPLATYHYFTEKSVCKMRDTECSQENADNRISEALDTVRNLFTCNIRGLPQNVINEILKQNKSGQAWSKYGKCLNASLSNEIQHNTERCLFDIEQNCKTANKRIAKILRLDFIHVEKLLQQLPKLNVLLLYRDPRAIMNSRIKTDWFPVNADEPDVVGNNIDSLCVKMENDFQTFERTKLKFRERMSKRNIEAVTDNSKGMRDIFKFINENVTKHDTDRIDSIMNRKRKNYLFRDWTKELQPEYRVQTETKCKTVLNDTE